MLCAFVIRDFNLVEVSLMFSLGLGFVNTVTQSRKDGMFIDLWPEDIARAAEERNDLTDE